MRMRLLATAAAVATALLVAGCGSEDGDGGNGGGGTGAAAQSPSGQGGEKDETAPAESPAAEDDTSAPESLAFTGTTLDGEDFDSSTLAGKPVVLWFWAPWCTTCQGQAEQTAKVAAEYEGKAHVVGVAGLDSEDAMRGFVSEYEVGGFTQLSDEPGEIWQKFGITEQSVYVVLDEEGEETFSGVLPGGEGLDGKLAGLTG